MSTDPTTGDDPFALHCGRCKHVYFSDDWDRTPYCSYHGRETEIRVGDVCSYFEERPSNDGRISRERGEPETDDTDESSGGIEIVESERLTGVTGPFYAIYTDGSKQGWYCSNCESTDVTADSMGRLKCEGCGNVHQSNEWDAAYL